MSQQIANPIQILDGGMSRELIRLNAPFKQPEWSALALIEAPHLVRQVHSNFAAAGADVLTTNSYALVPFHIGEERFHEQGEQLAALAGKLAREAADQEGRNVRVAGSLPPIFGSYEPEKYDGTRVQDYLSVLVTALNPSVDIWLGETLSLIAEAEAVKVAVAASKKPLWISFTLADEGEYASVTNPRLRSGQSVLEAAGWALESGVQALLFNCTRPEFMAAAVEQSQTFFAERNQGRKTPSIGVYANTFAEEGNTDAANANISATRTDLDAEKYASFAREWIARGASIIGGCCGIGPEHISHLSQASRNH